MIFFFYRQATISFSSGTMECYVIIPHVICSFIYLFICLSTYLSIYLFLFCFSVYLFWGQGISSEIRAKEQNTYQHFTSFSFTFHFSVIKKLQLHTTISTVVAASMALLLLTLLLLLLILLLLMLWWCCYRSSPLLLLLLWHVPRHTSVLFCGFVSPRSPQLSSARRGARPSGNIDLEYFTIKMNKQMP